MNQRCEKFERIKQAAKKGLRVHIHELGCRFSGFVTDLNEGRMAAKLMNAEQDYYFVGGNAANHLTVITEG